jgi:hypothetical protein
MRYLRVQALFCSAKLRLDNGGMPVKTQPKERPIIEMFLSATRTTPGTVRLSIGRGKTRIVIWYPSTCSRH